MKEILARAFASIILCVAAAVHSAGDVEIHQGPRHQRVRAGSPATFTCSAASRSHIIGVPYIEWQKDNRPLHYVKHGHYSKDPIDNSLTIFNTSTSDSGYYTCIASLNHHVDKASAQLLVEDVPDPPSEVLVTFCDARVAEIKWKLLNDNHSPITEFIVEYNTSFNPNHWHVAKTLVPRDRTYERIALSPWGNYSFRVIAHNSIGHSRPSRHSTICSTPPDMPHHNPRQVCTRNMAPHSLVVVWELMPEEEHNAPGFHYLVKWRRRDLETKKEDHEEKVIDRYTNELTIYNQPIYKPYEIYVLALNEVGEAVAPAKMHIGYSAEDIPLEIPHNFRLNPDKEVTSTTADFLWSPVSTGPWRMQGFFRGYKIEFWQTGEGPASIRYHSIIYRDPEHCLVKAEVRHKREVNTGHVYNLWPYTNITAQIRALNARYEGPPSNRIYFSTKEGVPGPVENLRVTKKGSHHFDVLWHKPRVINGMLIGYSIVYEVINSDEIYPKQELDLNDPEMNHIKLTSLVPDQTYRIHLWARTRVGRGQVYQIDERTLPEGPPVAPNFTTVNISKRAINVTWFPSHSGGNPGSVFTLHYRRLGQLQWHNTGKHTDQNWAVVSGLVPGVIYEMRVVARNGDGEGALETPSPVRRVRIGVRRDLSQPTFKTVFVGETSFGVGLLTYSKAVDSFYVQYRIRGEEQWRTTDDNRPEEWAIVSHLQPGRHYQFRVVTKSDLGESVSLVQEVIAGIDPGTNAQAAISDENAPTSAHGSSNRQLPRDFYQLYSSTLLIVYWQYRVFRVH